MVANPRVVRYESFSMKNTRLHTPIFTRKFVSFSLRSR